MGVIKWWRAWKAQRAANKNAKCFSAGFLWIMHAYYLEQQSIVEIDNLMYVPNEWRDANDTAFYKGADHALEIISVSLIKHGEYRGPNPGR